MKKAGLIICLALALLLCVPAQAFAVGGIDLAQVPSLTVNAFYGEVPVADLALSAYLVSTVDTTGELTPTSTFASYAQALDIRGQNDAAWQTMAQTLERDITLSAIAPTATATTSSTGAASFAVSTLGLYLITGGSVEKDGYVYTTLPFFVMLPRQDEAANTWVYSVAVNAKCQQNPVRMDYTVIKLWQDSCHASQRPQSITVQLMCDGAPYGAPVTLPEDGHWQHTWTQLDVNHKYTVTETRLSGYAEPVVSQQGTVFTITNTCDKPNSDWSKLPQTGQLWWPVPVLACAGVALVLVGLARRRAGKNEG